MVITLRNSGRVLALLAAFTMSGCQPERVTKANFDRIQEGMKLSEVEAILGKPATSYQGVVSWTTNHERTVISITLDDRGCVSEKNADGL